MLIINNLWWENFFNVPNLRFKEFFKEYSFIHLKDATSLITKGTTPHEFSDTGINFIKIDSLKGTTIDNKKVDYISSEVHEGFLKRSILKENDILLAIAGATVGKHAIVRAENLPANTNQALAIIRLNETVLPDYLLTVFDTDLIPNYVKNICTASAQPNLNLAQVGELFFGYPEIKEQEKVDKFIGLIDQRIVTQNKIIEDYKTYKNRILHIIYNSLESVKQIKLNDICSITTGKLDANAMNPNGKYKFFTCAKEDYYIDTYSFDGESLIISGNGEVGLIKYFNGKFDAYQRTYVLQNFKINPLYVKFALEIELPKKIHKEKNIGAMPYIVLSTLSNIMINIPSNETIEKIAKLVTSIDEKIAIEEKILNDYVSQKKYLLYNMFI